MKRRLLTRWWSTILCTSAALGFVWLAGARSAGSDPWKTMPRYELGYPVHLVDLAPSGKKVRLWVPYPAANRAPSPKSELHYERLEESSL
jgi:hypothetical protein